MTGLVVKVTWSVDTVIGLVVKVTWSVDTVTGLVVKVTHHEFTLSIYSSVQNGASVHTPLQKYCPVQRIYYICSQNSVPTWYFHGTTHIHTRSITPTHVPHEKRNTHSRSPRED